MFSYGKKYADSISLIVHYVREILDNAMGQVGSKSFSTRLSQVLNNHPANQIKLAIHIMPNKINLLPCSASVVTKPVHLGSEFMKTAVTW